MNNSIVVKSLAMLIAISVFIIPVQIFSQETASNTGTFTEGLMAGEMMAQGNIGWVAGGFCCGIFGVAGAFLIPSSPPSHLLVGKSSDYALGFTEGYKNESKKKNATYATIGCLGGMVLQFMGGM